MNNASESWMVWASFYELLAKSFLYPTKDLAEAIISGEYVQAAVEISQVVLGENVLPAEAYERLSVYEEKDAVELMHELRIEYTRLFIGSPRPEVSPYGGIWYAESIGVEPALFIGRETLEVERIMRAAGVGNPEETKEPLDHIGCELEFLQYLCVVLADVERPHPDAVINEGVYYDFLENHVRNWSVGFANAVNERCSTPFFSIAALLLKCV